MCGRCMQFGWLAVFLADASWPALLFSWLMRPGLPWAAGTRKRDSIGQRQCPCPPSTPCLCRGAAGCMAPSHHFPLFFPALLFPSILQGLNLQAQPTEPGHTGCAGQPRRHALASFLCRAVWHMERESDARRPVPAHGFCCRPHCCRQQCDSQPQILPLCCG